MIEKIFNFKKRNRDQKVKSGKQDLVRDQKVWKLVKDGARTKG